MIAQTLILAASLISVRDSATGFVVPPRPSAVLKAAAAERVPVTVWLDPIQPPPELRPAVVAAQLKPGLMLLHGHVSDRETGHPLAHVVVTAESSNVFARTDARGYFSMHVPAFDVDGLPAGEDLVMAIGGYKAHRIVNTMLMSAADTHFVVRLERGDGTTSRDDSHKIWLHRPGGEHPHEDLPEAETTMTATSLVTIPDTIRVGFECSNATSCGRVEIFSLETYVKRGLNDEWIASWHPESLRAGAVAYRSYGAYHVAHPRTASYDICSTTSCQVNDADTSLAADNAVDVTRGAVVVQNGGIFRSEYSAELNNLLGTRSCSNIDRSCGDGFAGSPAAGWPCLADPVCTGSDCFGHGRGMCQWGTQRWALQAKDWRWIVNHYYSGGQGLRNSVLIDENTRLPRRRAVAK